MLVGAWIGGVAMRAGLYLWLGIAEHGLETVYVFLYLGSLLAAIVKDIGYYKLAVATIAYYIKGVYLIYAVRNDIVLHRSVATKDILHLAIVLHLEDVDSAIGRFAHHVGQHQHIVVEESSLENHPLARSGKHPSRSLGVLVHLIAQQFVQGYAVGICGLVGSLKLAAAFE